MYSRGKNATLLNKSGTTEKKSNQNSISFNAEYGDTNQHISLPHESVLVINYDYTYICDKGEVHLYLFFKTLYIRFAILLCNSRIRHP